MSSILDTPPVSPPRLTDWASWLPVLLGLVLLYLPTIVRLFNGLWNEEAYAHGPIILMIVVWLAWRQHTALQPSLLVAASAAICGTVVFLSGLLIYVVGRSQNIPLFEVGSSMPVLAGILLLARGWGGLQVMWFPLLFLIFLVPLPGFFIDAITGPLKGQVSNAVETILYWAGYPIARTGVVISIGNYQLLVADACSGLNSMFSLTALGFLYLHLMPAPSLPRNALVIASILPIAFVANVVRVMVLVLVTYYLGDEAGQGFLHGIAGLVLFVVALLLLLSVDVVLRRLIGVQIMARPQ